MIEKWVRKWNLKIKQPIIDNRKLCYWCEEIIKKVKPSYTEEIEEKVETTEDNKISVNDESHYL